VDLDPIELRPYIDAAGIRAETKIPSSALAPAGPVRSSERQELHRTPGAWSQAVVGLLSKHNPSRPSAPQVQIRPL
jgi:hypothetical protein